MKTRYDAFIIWGNGLHLKEKIISRLRAALQLDILRIQIYKPNDIRRFVKAVYSTDFVPLHHIQSKIMYLLDTKAEVIIIIVLNKAPEEKMVGEGAFRHTQCMTIKEIKENIRDAYNPRKNGKRTEEHVIHATDIETQTDKLLKIIGIRQGLDYIKKSSNSILQTPYHLSHFTNFSISQTDLNDLWCNIINTGVQDARQTVRIKQTPHYLFLNGDRKAYEEYYFAHQGISLLDDHSPEEFDRLATDFDYLASPHELSYILTQRENGELVIRDGLHRAAILAFRNKKKVLTATIEDAHGQF